MKAPAVPAALAALYAKRPAVIKPGLARIEAALAALDRESLLGRPTVLVAGTNGKGTTTGFLWRLLTGVGVKAGLFTSPHLVRFSERVQVSGESVDDARLVAELAALERDLPADVYEPLSFFEVNTLLALRLFRRAAVDVELLEVGLGGRWDSTNVSRPLLSVITSIGLDHMEFLGRTTAAIAGEKAGIMRPGRPVIWGGDEAGDADAVRVLRERAAGQGSPLWELGREFGDLGTGVRGAEPPGSRRPPMTSARLPGCPPVTAPWPRAAASWPGFLRRNYQLAFASFVCLWQSPELASVRARLGLADPEAAALSAVAALDAGTPPVPACMRARFDRVRVSAPDGGTRDLLLDVCHNVDGARALVRGLRETGLAPSGKRLPGFVSILADKDHAAVLGILREVLDPVVLFASGSERTWRPELLMASERDVPFYGSFAKACAAHPEFGAAPAFSPAVVCGSVHAVGEVAAELGLL